MHVPEVALLLMHQLLSADWAEVRQLDSTEFSQTRDSSRVAVVSAQHHAAAAAAAVACALAHAHAAAYVG